MIGREESDHSVREFIAKHGYSFPAAADPERSLYSLYAEELIPRTYLITRDGAISYATTGFHKDDIQSLKDELAQQVRVRE